MHTKEWAKKGKMVSVFNTELFVIDEGNSNQTLVLLHGYATSSLDYHKILEELSKNYRVILYDFLGFGFSDKPKNHYINIQEQADIFIELWRKLELENVTLLSHNISTQIALEILTRQRLNYLHLDINKLIILNSTISFNQSNISNASIHPLEKFSKKIKTMLLSYPFYKQKIKDFFFDGNKISDEEIEGKWSVIEHKNGREILDFLPSYIIESKLSWNRWFTSAQLNTLAVKIISGKNDNIFNEDEAISFANEFSNSTLHFIDNCGHYPMLEKPKELVDIILNF